MAKVILKGIQLTDPEILTAKAPATATLDLEIHDKELLVLAGPAGSGKTALLGVIAGLEEVSKGAIFIGDKQVMGIKDREVALVFEGGALLPQLSVHENLAFGLKLRRVPKAEADRRVREAISILKIEPFLEKQVDELSDADRQRIAMARAMVRQPKIFLLDAPLRGLEPTAQGALRAEIIGLHERLQATMLYATADPMEALALGERIAVIEKGIIQQVDTPANIYHYPANLFVAGFFGAPPMNLIRGSLKRVGEGLQFRESGEGSIECKLGEVGDPAAIKEYAGREIVLGIRPEQIRPVVDGDDADRASCGGIVSSGVLIKGLADHVEPQGAGTLIHFQTGAHSLASHSNLFLDRSETGHRMQFELTLAKACFFDPVTSLRIGARINSRS